MRRSDISRRRLLQSVAALGAAAGLPAPGARAARPPLRVLFYVTSHGTVFDQWRLRPAGVRDEEDWDRPLSDLLPRSEGEKGAADAWSPILAPLEAHQDDLLVLDGITNGCAMVARYNEHQAGNASCQTGRIPTQVAAERSIVDGDSIDQAIAAQRNTPFPSLEYAVGGAPVSYNPVGVSLPFESDPVEAWFRLFPDADPDDRVRQLQGSVLAFAAQRYGRLASGLAGEGGQRLAAHGALVSDLERRRALLAEVDCAPTDRPTEPPSVEHPDYPVHQVDAFQELMVAALSCGLTEVGTLRVDHIPPATIGAPPGNLHADVAHSVSTDPRAAELMTAYHTFHAERFADLLDRLRAVPDGSGTLLDNTLVVWHNEMATGDHVFSRTPFVLAGATGRIRRGRVLHFADRGTIEALWYDQQLAIPHQRMLATLGVAAGLDIDAFGTPSLRDVNGAEVDCTGLVPGVLA